MSCNYTLQLLGVRGLPGDFGRIVLEVTVRTPRLWSSIRQKYSSEPVPLQWTAAPTVHWTQGKAAKAYVRLRLLPGNVPAEASTAGGDAAAASSLVPAGAAIAQPVTVAAAIATAGRVTAPCLDRAAAWMPYKSAEALLPLTMGPGQQVTQQQLQLSLPLEPEARDRERSSAGAGGTQPAAALPPTVDLDLVVLAEKGGSSGGGASAAGAVADSTVTAASANAVAGATSGTSVSLAWAWTEVASAPAPMETTPPSAAPRKRSWLLALGLGRHGGGSNGATVNGAHAARVDPVVRRGSAQSKATLHGGGATALAEASSQGACGWDPVAALSSVTTTTTATAAVMTVGAVSSSSLPAASTALQEAGGSGASAGTGGFWIAAAAPPPPPAPPGRRCMPLLPRQPPDDAAPPGAGAALQLSPFVPSALAAEASTGLPDGATTHGSWVAAGAASRPPLLAATMAHAPSGCSEPQPPKRRRLGDFFARLFHSSSFQNQVRRIAAGVETSAASIGPADAAVPPAAGAAVTAAGGDAAAVPSAAASDPWVARPPQFCRNGSPLGITPLQPPSPRLGDVYRVQDSALVSDAAVQLGFSDVTTATAVGGGTGFAVPVAAAVDAQPGSVLGLDSPGYGETSPAGGPDRLTIEPPVEDMAATSLASPMATSPETPAGGCFFWRYGAAARARAAVAATGCGASGLGRTGSAPMPGDAPGCAAAAARPLHALSTVADGALPAAFSTSAPLRCSSPADGSDRPPQQQSPQPQPPQQQSTQPHHHPQQQQQQQQSPQPQPPQQQSTQPHHQQKTPETAGGAHSLAAAAAWSHPLEGEISRVVEFVSGQTQLEEELRVGALSQCQFLLDCLRNPDMCWLVGDSLMQLKHEVGFPFDTGLPIAGAPGWCRLVLQPMQPQPAPATGDPDGVAPPPPPEVLKVRWAGIDQRQVGGSNACAAIGLEVAAWCLAAVQRWRQAVTAATEAGGGGSGASVSAGVGVCGGRRDSAARPQPYPHTESAGGGGGGGGRQEVTAALSRSQRDRERLASTVDMESMGVNALDACIRIGTAVWQGVLVQSLAAHVASSTGDFDLEHMLELGGYSHRLRLAEYHAASLLEDAVGGGGSAVAGGAALRRSSVEVAFPGSGAANATAVAASVSAATSLMPPSSPEPPPPPSSSRAQTEGHRLSRPPMLQLTSPSGSGCLATQGSVPCGGSQADPQALSDRTRLYGAQGGLPSFAALVHSLQQGVYVLGWRGHFATLWLRPGGMVQLIDSLGARLAADCPLAFALEFDDAQSFLAFFLSRHTVRRDAAPDDDIAAANAAALIEVHRLELLQPL